MISSTNLATVFCCILFLQGIASSPVGSKRPSSSLSVDLNEETMERESSPEGHPGFLSLQLGLGDNTGAGTSRPINNPSGGGHPMRPPEDQRMIRFYSLPPDRSGFLPSDFLPAAHDHEERAALSLPVTPVVITQNRRPRGAFSPFSRTNTANPMDVTLPAPPLPPQLQPAEEDELTFDQLDETEKHLNTLYPHLRPAFVRGHVAEIRQRNAYWRESRRRRRREQQNEPAAPPPPHEEEEERQDGADQ